jgi:hypothetical protein
MVCLHFCCIPKPKWQRNDRDMTINYNKMTTHIQHDNLNDKLI